MAFLLNLEKKHGLAHILKENDPRTVVCHSLGLQNVPNELADKGDICTLGWAARGMEVAAKCII